MLPFLDDGLPSVTPYCYQAIYDDWIVAIWRDDDGWWHWILDAYINFPASPDTFIVDEGREASYWLAVQAVNKAAITLTCGTERFTLAEDLI